MVDTHGPLATVFLDSRAGTTGWLICGTVKKWRKRMIDCYLIAVASSLAEIYYSHHLCPWVVSTEMVNESSRGLAGTG